MSAHTRKYRQPSKRELMEIAKYNLDHMTSNQIIDVAMQAERENIIKPITTSEKERIVEDILEAFKSPKKRKKSKKPKRTTWLQRYITLSAIMIGVVGGMKYTADSISSSKNEKSSTNELCAQFKGKDVKFEVIDVRHNGQCGYYSFVEAFKVSDANKYPVSHISLTTPDELRNLILDYVKKDKYYNETVPWKKIQIETRVQGGRTTRSGGDGCGSDYWMTDDELTVIAKMFKDFLCIHIYNTLTLQFEESGTHEKCDRPEVFMWHAGNRWKAMRRIHTRGCSNTGFRASSSREANTTANQTRKRVRFAKYDE